MPTKNRERRLAARREWYRQHKDDELNAMKIWRANNLEKHTKITRNSHYANSYGLSVEVVDRAIAMRDGRCDACDQKPNRRRLCIDHDHKTGQVRGMLCGNCNRALGLLKDSAERCEMLRQYIAGWCNGGTSVS